MGAPSPPFSRIQRLICALLLPRFFFVLQAGRSRAAQRASRPTTAADRGPVATWLPTAAPVGNLAPDRGPVTLQAPRRRGRWPKIRNAVESGHIGTAGAVRNATAKRLRAMAVLPAFHRIAQGRPDLMKGRP